jgi:hypothetical protein
MSFTGTIQSRPIPIQHVRVEAEGKLPRAFVSEP